MDRSALLSAAQHRLSLNNQQMAAELRCSPEWYSKLTNGHRPVSDDMLLRLNELLRRRGLEPIELNLGAQKLSGVQESGQSAYDASTKIEPMLRFVPVISWVHAGEAVAYEEIPKYEQERVSSMCTDSRAFAIIVEGESMLPDFKPGDRVIVAPSRDPRNGKPCVIKLMDDGVLLRLFHRVSKTRIRLSSLRPEIYPSTELEAGEYRWCWPVEELSRRV